MAAQETNTAPPVPAADPASAAPQATPAATPVQPASAPPVQAVAAVPPAQPPAAPPAAPPPASTGPLNLPEEDDEEIPLERRNNRIYITGIILSLIVLAVTVGVFFYRLKQKDTSTSEVVVEEIEAPETEAQPPAEEEEEAVEQLERSEITLEILNGSGVAGLAGDTADIFEALGYEIGDVGNTEATEGNQLYISEDVDEDSLEVLLDDVKDELEITKVTGTLDDIDGTARIVLGASEESEEEEEE